jgi:hypothetical protein
METLNLNDMGDSGMVPLAPPVQKKPSVTFADPPAQKLPEKNIVKQQMDSTPIADVMGPADAMMMDQPMMHQQPMMAQAPAVQASAQKAPAASKNPMGITDEQYQALIAGVCAILAFSNPVQEKLLSAVPQFMADGARSTSGLIATGLIAAIIFYFAQRMLMKN